VLANTPPSTEWEITLANSLRRFRRLPEKRRAVLRRLLIRALAAGTPP
jgi:hypothetical protein